MSELSFATIVGDHLRRNWPTAEAAERARRYPESDGRHPKWDYREPSAELRAMMQAEDARLRAMLTQRLYADDPGHYINAGISDIMRGASPRVRQFPENHRYDHLVAMARLED